MRVLSGRLLLQRDVTKLLMALPRQPGMATAMLRMPRREALS